MRLTRRSFDALPGNDRFCSRIMKREERGRRTGKLEDFSSEVFEDCCDIDGGLGTDSHLVLGLRLQETLDTTTWELQKKDQLRYSGVFCAGSMRASLIAGAAIVLRS